MEPSDWAISAAMAEFGFSLFPNIWDGARLKDPGREFECVDEVLVNEAVGGREVRVVMEVTTD